MSWGLLVALFTSAVTFFVEFIPWIINITS